MRAVVQRVLSASVSVEGAVTGAIERGLLVFLGAGTGDGANDLSYVVDKIANLRIFADDARPDDNRMNRSVLDVGGGVLVISQFTLYGDVRGGRRPAFTGALEPVAARRCISSRSTPCARSASRVSRRAYSPRTWPSRSSTTGP